MSAIDQHGNPVPPPSDRVGDAGDYDDDFKPAPYDGPPPLELKTSDPPPPPPPPPPSPTTPPAPESQSQSSDSSPAPTDSDAPAPAEPSTPPAADSDAPAPAEPLTPKDTPPEPEPRHPTDRADDPSEAESHDYVPPSLSPFEEMLDDWVNPDPSESPIGSPILDNLDAFGSEMVEGLIAEIQGTSDMYEETGKGNFEDALNTKLDQMFNPDPETQPFKSGMFDNLEKRGKAISDFIDEQNRHNQEMDDLIARGEFAEAAEKGLKHDLELLGGAIVGAGESIKKLGEALGDTAYNLAHPREPGAQRRLGSAVTDSVLEGANVAGGAVEGIGAAKAMAAGGVPGLLRHVLGGGDAIKPGGDGPDGNPPRRGADGADHGAGDTQPDALPEIRRSLPQKRKPAPRQPKSHVDWSEKGGHVEYHQDGSVAFVDDRGIRVKYDPEGFPDFEPHSVKKVKLPNGQKGGKKDYGPANKIAFGKSTAKIPEGHTWHHHHDGKHMLLVPRHIHDVFPHTGGTSLVDQ